MLYVTKKSLFFLFVAAVLVISVFDLGISNHDFQRIAQVFIGCFSLVFLCCSTKKSHPLSLFYALSKFSFFWVILCGLLSSFKAHQPAWALTELSVFWLSCGITVAFAQQRVCSGAGLDKFFIGFVVFICSIKLLQFLSSVIAAFLASNSIIDTDLLFEGFSNKRFYGQFQTFTLPLLALPLLYRGRLSSKILVFGLMSCWWMIAVTGGTRGTWLGMGGAICLSFCLGRAGRYWAVWQLSAALSGVLLFTTIFNFLPAWLGWEVGNFAGDRLTTSLSAREVLWQQAWGMIKDRPLLGFGPMHFADIWNPVGSHPHQAILQWASEWGVPSTLIVMGLAFQGLFATWQLIRKRALSSEPIDLLRLCLFASLIGALTQSMVDGVIVMPYSQLWLALVVGWLLALHEWQMPLRPVSQLGNGLWLASLTLAAGLLLYTIVRDFPQTEAREQQFAQEFGGRYLPRFWMQGVITLPDRAAGQALLVR